MTKKVSAVVIGLSALVLTSGVIAREHEQGTKQDAHHPPATVEEAIAQMQELGKHIMAVLGDADPEYDQRFLDIMIHHHEDGIKMSRDALQKAQHPELRKKAEEMIRMQEKDNEEMKQWREQWYGQKS
jgi:uncharacterized protein (DUF305 family)